MIVKYKLGISASLLCGLQVGQLISLCNSMKLMIQNQDRFQKSNAVESVLPYLFLRAVELYCWSCAVKDKDKVCISLVLCCVEVLCTVLSQTMLIFLAEMNSDSDLNYTRRHLCWFWLE